MTRTSVVIDENMIEEAQRLTALESRQAVIDLALRELIAKLRRQALLDIRRTDLWEGNLGDSRKSRTCNQ